MRYSVSIIINNYNYARFLGRAIESALAQTYPDVEVIVVDDGSTDESLEIIHRYGSRLKCIAKQNGGQASAFNAGFAASMGDIILFLDADDVLEPRAAAALADVWRTNVAKAQFPLVAVDESERPLGYTLPLDPVSPGREMEFLRLHGNYPSPPSTGNAYDRHALQVLLPMPEAVWRMNADVYLVALAPFLGAVIYLSDALASYRIHRSNGYAGRLDLGTLRNRLVWEARIEHEVRRWAALRGQPIERDPMIRLPGHYKTRLLSLRLDREGHPFAEDTVFSILRASLVAVWSSPHLTWKKRLIYSFAFPLVAIMPRYLLRRSIVPLFIPAARRITLRPSIRLRRQHS